MKLPTRNRNWLKEVQLAYGKATRELARRNITISEIYTLAPEYVAKNRGIKDAKKIQDILDWIIANVAQEKELEPDAKGTHRFHFVSAYIIGHQIAGLLDEMACDRIIDYINSEWDLFSDA